MNPNLLNEIKAAIDLIVAILPIIKEAVSVFGAGNPAAKQMVVSAIPTNTPPAVIEHVMSFVDNHLAERAKLPAGK